MGMGLAWTTSEIEAAMRKALSELRESNAGTEEEESDSGADGSYLGRISEDKREGLGAIRSTAREVIGIIDDVLVDGMPMTVACRKRGMEYIRFRRFCDRFLQVMTGGRVARDNPIYAFEPTIEERLYARVFGMKAEEVCDVMPDDAEEAVSDVLGELREDERDVLLARLRGGSLSEVGEERGVSRERIRQIESKAIRKLRSTPSMRKLRLGQAEMTAIEEEFAREREQARDEYARIVKARDAEMRDLVRMTARYKMESDGVYGMSIDSLDLSVRAWNVLHRNRIETVGELSDWSVRDLSELRNMGRGTLREIELKLSALGITLRER